MKTTTYLGILRTLSTLFFAAAIFATKNEGTKYFQAAFCVASGCILGGFHGAGAVGIFMIFFAAKNGFQSIFSGYGGTLWGLFLGAAAAGCFSGLPSAFEKFPPEKKLALKIFSGAAAGFACYVVSVFVFRRDFFADEIPAMILLLPEAFSVWLISILVRPVLARKIYPPSKEKEELAELMEKLK
jgi:hypothetical protein